MTDYEPSTPLHGELIFYQTKDGLTKLDVRVSQETVWLSLGQLSELFQRDKSVISKHIKNIFDEGELTRDSVVANFATTASDGKTYQVTYHNLQLIISVGYRVKSQRGVQFRTWATNVLKQFIVKGFVLDDNRLKNPPGPDVPDHFDELLERIRDIRASERRMYLRILDILSLAADYQPNDDQAVKFFQIVQNKMHFTVTGKTAPEIIAERANATKPNMGLTAWKGDRVLKTDITIAKNYLNEAEITELNRIVVMFLDFAEDQTRRRKQIYLSDWQKRLDDFLRFNDRDILPNAGNVTREQANQLASDQYSEFQKRRREIAELEGEAANLKALEASANEVKKSKPEPNPRE